VDGSTPKKERDQILKEFRSGKLQVVANCQVWTEGVDVPEASAALMVCPTKSDLAYVQKLGRILRTAKGKLNALVLDFAPIEERNVIMAGDILGVPRAEREAREKAEKAGVIFNGSRTDSHGLTVSVDPTIVIVEALQYLQRGKLAWTLQDYVAVASLSELSMLLIELPNVHRLAEAERMKTDNDWNEGRERLYQSVNSHRLWLCSKGAKSWSAAYQGSFETMESAVRQGELLVNAHYRAVLAKKRSPWRSKKASEAQIQFMRRLGVVPPEMCTQGQAAQLISHQLATKAVERVRVQVDTQIMKGQRNESDRP
jgi:hypothetical protein